MTALIPPFRGDDSGRIRDGEGETIAHVASGRRRVDYGAVAREIALLMNDGADARAVDRARAEERDT